MIPACGYPEYNAHLCFVLRVRQLRQSCVCAGCHSGHERFPDWDEEAEGPAEALQERKQTLLILGRGLPPSPALMLALLG